MHDAFAMCFSEGLGDLHSVFENLAKRKRTFGQPVRERFAVEELHDDVVLADVIERANVGMRELGDGLRLACETKLELGILREFRRQDLDRHLPIEPRIAGTVDLPHPARPDRSDDLVRPQARTGSDCHREG